MKTRVCVIAGIIMTLMTPLGTMSAGRGTLPQAGLPFLSARWWQWAYSIPSVTDPSGDNENPILDTTGAYCMVGQQGSTWFLAGDIGTGSVTRSCSVPEGVALFFPVINFINFNTPGCPPGTPSMTAEQLQVPLEPAIDTVNSYPLSVTVDRVDVTKTLLRLVESQPFELPLPPENLFGPNACGTNLPLAPGIYSPAVAEGYYVKLARLPRGAHTIAFHAESTSSFFGTVVEDVTWNITVVPVSLE
jgi:hypothetical protein